MRTIGALTLAALVGAACHFGDIAGFPNDELKGGRTPSDSILTHTYEEQWVGTYVGTARVELFDTQDVYDGVAVRFEAWVEEGRLRGVVRVELSVPLGPLLHIADTPDAGEALIPVSCLTAAVTSAGWVSLGGRSAHGDLVQVLELARVGAEVLGDLQVNTAYAYGQPVRQVARVSLRLTPGA